MRWQGRPGADRWNCTTKTNNAVPEPPPPSASLPVALLPYLEALRERVLLDGLDGVARKGRNVHKAKGGDALAAGGALLGANLAAKLLGHLRVKVAEEGVHLRLVRARAKALGNGGLLVLPALARGGHLGHAEARHPRAAVLVVMVVAVVAVAVAVLLLFALLPGGAHGAVVSRRRGAGRAKRVVGGGAGREKGERERGSREREEKKKRWRDLSLVR